MSIRNKLALSALAVTLVFPSIAGGLPGGSRAAEKLGWISVASAEEGAPPAVEPPVVEPPVIEPPVVEPPVAEPPVVEPPVVEPPVVEPPVVEPPVVEPPAVEPPVVEPPIIEPPVDPNAEWIGLLSSGLLNRVNELFAALAAGDPADIQDVQNLRVEIASLNDAAYLPLIDPIWNKISGRFPPTVDQAAAKASLLRFIKAIGSAQYDPDLSEFKAIRRNPEFIALFGAVQAAGGVNVTVQDVFTFLLGDGQGLKGIEGALVDRLSGLQPVELALLLADQQKLTTVALQAVGEVLADAQSYKISALLANLNVTAADIGTVVRGFQQKLQKDEPAVRALLIAYLRTGAEASAAVSEDGREHRYSLRVFGVEVPSIVLQWAKVSGDPEANVSVDGVVTIPPTADSATAVIRASLVHPFTGVTKTILEKQVTLTAAATPGDVFPAEPFVARMNAIRDALLAGDPSDAQAVRALKAELIGLDAASNGRLLDPVWSRIAPRLPADADQASLRTGLFEAVKAAAALPYEVQASDVEAALADARLQETLKAIGTAGGVKNLSMSDYLIFWYGDGGERGGVEGEMQAIVSRMRSTELGRLFDNPERLDNVRDQAVSAILSRTDAYPLSAALTGLDVRSADIGSAIRNFQAKLRTDAQADIAWNSAYVRSAAVPAVDVEDNGRTHYYGLTLLGVEIPSSVLKWSKVSGSKDVKVTSNGKATISKKIATATAVIQATWTDRGTRQTKVLFRQEVTLVNGDYAGTVEEIVATMKEQIQDIGYRLEQSTTDEEKVQLLLETIQVGKTATTRINEAEAPKKEKDKAINETKKLTSRMASRILQELMDF